jgi:hypothetical protein
VVSGVIVHVRPTSVESHLSFVLTKRRKALTVGHFKPMIRPISNRAFFGSCLLWGEAGQLCTQSLARGRRSSTEEAHLTVFRSRR